VVVNKKLLTSSTIFQMLLDSGLPTPRCLALEDAEVAEIIVDEGSKATRRPVMDLNLPKGINIAGVIRDGVGRLVSGSTVLRGGDHVVVVCLSGALDKFTRTFR
jgi:trk system potassium uptake protein TrkA